MQKAMRMTSAAKLHQLAQLTPQAYDWYDKAYSSAAGLAVEYDCSIDRAAAILAITSPRVSVSRNLKNAATYLRTGKLSGVIPATIKGLETYESTGKVSGPKVSAFYDAIRTGGYCDAVVLDVHMANALGIPQEKLFNKANHTKAIGRVNQVAEWMNIYPAQAQACIWSGYLLNKGYNLSVRDL